MRALMSSAAPAMRSRCNRHRSIALIGNASVYVRYDEAPSGLLHKTHQAELNFKSNQDGTVKVPSVPRGKVLIQVIAPGWHTYGEWYDVTKDEQLIDIHLAKPPRWY